MNNKIHVRLFSRIWLLIVFISAFSQHGFSKDKTYAPEDLPQPVFDSVGFIIDPAKKIIEEWYLEIINTRETYYFPRYIEPVCVRVDYIKSPEDPEAYADRLIELWDLENKTNGRFVFQLQCKSKQAVVYRIGSRLKSFFKTDFLSETAADIIETHLAGKATGTGDFVSIQKLGEHIFEEIAFDAKILNYDGNTGVHSQYPNKVERSYGELKTMKKSFYQDDDPIFTGEVSTAFSNNSTDETITYSDKNYFDGLVDKRVNMNYARINTVGVISDYKQVENPREKDNGSVTDPHFMLDTFAINMINDLLDTLELKTGFQVAVVCLNSIGDNDPHGWGTDLFNHWGIGQKDLDNGLLILVINDQHAVEFITGRGTETILTDGDCYDIQQNEMVPYYKLNDYVTGTIRGVQATCDFLYGTPPLYSSDTGYDDSDYTFDEYEYVSEPFQFFESGFFYFLLWSGGLMTAAWIIAIIFSFSVRDPYKRYHIMKFFSLGIWPFVIPIPFVVLYFLTKSIMERWRNTVRFNSETGEEMHKLGDHEEDKHLSQGQEVEEKVKSIDYDVWVTADSKRVMILSYKKWFTKYNKCPSCSFKTYFKEYDRTITPATYTSSGTGEKKYKCENCGHSKITTYVIPKKTKSSSGGSSYGGGGGYSRSYSSGGGSSFGGGSSRGGGAGSRW
ncbi:MAG: TPM domain-containing protein [Crocinitomicaceae bacterium]|nr:TPM domain-containing protein [Crocinitomicaceae bacterium]